LGTDETVAELEPPFRGPHIGLDLDLSVDLDLDFTPTSSSPGGFHSKITKNQQ